MSKMFFNMLAVFAEFEVDVQAKGEHTIAELAEMFSVSRPTVYRVLSSDAGGTTTKESAA